MYVFSTIKSEMIDFNRILIKKKRITRSDVKFSIKFSNDSYTYMKRVGQFVYVSVYI